MPSFNEKFILLHKVQQRDEFGSLLQSVEEVTEKWCKVMESKGFFHEVKGGKKRVQLLTICTWLATEINHDYIVRYNNIEYNVVNAIHNRINGTTKIQCEFNE